MNKNDLRKKLVQNLPYLLIGLYVTKLSQAWRLAAGKDASEKLLHYSAGLSEALQSPLPSFAVCDLLFGAAKLNLDIADLPVRYRERTYGDTNISRWRDGWILFTVPHR